MVLRLFMLLLLCGLPAEAAEESGAQSRFQIGNVAKSQRDANSGHAARNEADFEMRENGESNPQRPWQPGAGGRARPVPQPQLVSPNYVVIDRAKNGGYAPPFLTNPAIVETHTGRLLVCYGGKLRGGRNSLTKSDDGGESWQALDPPGSAAGAALFKSASGLYLLYPMAHWKKPNRNGQSFQIRRSDDDGESWSESTPIAVTAGLAASRSNVGALVSGGRVTLTIEAAPARSYPLRQTRLAEPLKILDEDLDRSRIWVSVDDASVFPPYAFVAIEQNKERLHARVRAVDVSSNRLLLAPERWRKSPRYQRSPNNSPGPWLFEQGADIRVATGTLGNHRDVWIYAIDAPDQADIDLCNPGVWRISNPVANPAFAYGEALHDLFGMEFDYRDPTGVPDPEGLWSGWMEGVALRLEHPGGDGRVVSLMRVGQDVSDSISSRIVIDDRGDALEAEFLRFGFDEGLGVSHCYAEYDARGRLYWMVSNVNRNSARKLEGVRLHGDEAIQERSNLALFFSRNARDWFMAGMIAYSRDWAHSFHYPHFEISGDDLLVVARSHIETELTEDTINRGGNTADNHDANAITFHRVPQFRELANEDFIWYLTPD